MPNDTDDENQIFADSMALEANIGMNPAWREAMGLRNDPESLGISDEGTVLACPECGSDDIARILWGKPMFSEELQRDLDAGRTVLGGCCIAPGDPDWHCNACGNEFGPRKDAFEEQERHRAYQLRSIVYGAAVGDALGVPFEFMQRGSFECTGMVGGGVHGMPVGTFSDDTSMMLATCDSLRERGRVDVDDMRQRYKAWLHEGTYAADGVVFDVGNATATALDQGHGCDDERSNGNGSLMRIAPLALAHASDKDVRAVSAITHAHWWSTEACVIFTHILRGILNGGSLENLIESDVPDKEPFVDMRNLKDLPRDQVRSGGFVLDTLGAVLWCALHASSYAECVLEAVNLGDDSDTTACVAGALAGALYGYDAIPTEWLEALRGKELIESCLACTELDEDT